MTKNDLEIVLSQLSSDPNSTVGAIKALREYIAALDKKIAEMDRQLRIYMHLERRAQALGRKIRNVRKEAVQYKRWVDYRIMRDANLRVDKVNVVIACVHAFVAKYRSVGIIPPEILDELERQVTT